MILKPPDEPAKRGLPWTAVAGIICLVLAALCLTGAGIHVFRLEGEERTAKERVDQVMEAWETRGEPVAVKGGDVLPVGETVLAADGAGTEGMPVTEPAVLVGDTAYIGTVFLPTLGLTLPVQPAWDHEEAKYSPCRYKGRAADSDLILAGHNYRHHFGRLPELEPGDPVAFTDASGTEYQYEVVLTETLSGTDAASMDSGEYPLTLFTCTALGDKRVTVRCNYKNK